MTKMDDAKKQRVWAKRVLAVLSTVVVGVIYVVSGGKSKPPGA